MTVFAMLQGAPTVDLGTCKSALALARHIKTSLTGLCALPDPQMALMLVTTPESIGMTGAATKTLIELQQDLLAKAEATFRQAVSQAPAGVEATFVHQVATAETAAANAATLADAIVFPRAAAKAGEPLSLAFEHVLMDARLPAILAGEEDYVPGPVVMGWDGSPGAARAVRLHQHLLQAAGDVIIAQNEKDARRDDPAAVVSPDVLAGWLSHRGIKSKSASIEGNVADALRALAKGSGATMIVAGAYGHSKLGQRLFGGTSRSLLASTSPALALAR